jgi:hypothetical protein
MDIRVKRSLDIAMLYGGIDGSHHKMWVIDQMVRALTDCPLITKNEEGYEWQEYGISDTYVEWVRQFCIGEDGADTYDWDTGIAP